MACSTFLWNLLSGLRTILVMILFFFLVTSLSLSSPFSFLLL